MGIELIFQNSKSYHFNILGGAICSIDLHPDGQKVATGILDDINSFFLAGYGQIPGSGLLVIWDIDSINDSGDKNEVRNETGKLASIPFTSIFMSCCF